MIIQPMNQPLNGMASLTHLGVIGVRGEDAATFLQGQLTQDFALLGTDDARLAAFCTAKGRMQASFIGLRYGPDELLLVCQRDLLAQTLKRLSMFVLRAKVKLRDATAEFQLQGLVGDAVTHTLNADAPAWRRVDIGADVAAGVAVFLYPADGQTRALLVQPVNAPAPVVCPISLSDWQWSEVRSGVVLVAQPIFEALVPQMLNYESVGGVSFKKGCYPGQEISARSQFRGTLKRRAYLVHADAALSAGQEVFEASDREQPCGIVVQAAVAPGGGSDAVVSMQIAAAAAGNLHVSTADGPALELLPLPYALLVDI